MFDNNWPPESWQLVYQKYQEWAAWYSGDPGQLGDFYSSLFVAPDRRSRMWAAKIQDERRTMLHIPVAGDIATTSADLLFGESPDIKIPESQVETPAPEATAAQERLDNLLEWSEVYARLYEAAESAAVLGGVFLKINWDASFKPFPILSVAQADNALPEFKFGFLRRVTFHVVVKVKGSTVWRHLEKHDRGVILNELWEGSADKLGKQVELTNIDETAGLLPEIKTGIDKLAVAYIPNKKPNRLFRGSGLGQSDLQGLEGLMDALDEVYTSWMRDIKLTKARIMAPEWALKKQDDQWAFDADEEVFATYEASPDSADKELLKVIQFPIRAEEFYKTCLELFTRIITSAGYSPQSFGIDVEGRADSGTALRIREKRSFNTKDKKETYFQSPLEEILAFMVEIDCKLFAKDIKPFKPQVAFGDGVQQDLGALAEALALIAQAAAASTEVKVRLLHPDKDENWIKDEAKKINAEMGISVDPPDEFNKV